MKRISFFFLILFLFSEISAQDAYYSVASVPNPRTGYGGFIADPGKVLDESSLRSLNADLLKLEKDTSAEFAIVILPSIGQGVPKDFAVELFNYWGIGKKKKDNGLLLLLVMDQRRWEFETGYGLEGVLPDAILKRIGEDRLVPKLRQKKAGEGFADVISEVTRRIKKEPESVTSRLTQTEEPVQAETEKHELSFLETLALTFFSYFSYIIPIYAIVFFLGIHYFKNKEGKKSSILFSGTLINWKLVSVGLIPFLFYGIYIFFAFHYVNFVYLIRPSYIFTSISCLFFLFQHYRNLDQKEYKDPYDYYKAIDLNFKSWEFIIISILFPLPLIFFVIWSLVKKRQLRVQVRVCPKCNTDMVRLDEDKDDFFLKDGQKIEEKIGSIDYDVWFCEKSKDVKIYAYESLFTSYSKCPSCKYKTYFVESDNVTVSPTCTSSGSGIRHYACKNCSHTSSSTYTIPARDCSKASSSGSSYSSGSSSSSSSFGGGRSGGGGAGGSW